MEVQFVQTSNIGLYLERMGIPFQHYNLQFKRMLNLCLHSFSFLISFQFLFLHRVFFGKNPPYFPYILFGQYTSPLPWDQRGSYLGLYSGQVRVLCGFILGLGFSYLMFVIGLWF